MLLDVSLLLAIALNWTLQHLQWNPSNLDTNVELLGEGKGVLFRGCPQFRGPYSAVPLIHECYIETLLPYILETAQYRAVSQIDRRRLPIMVCESASPSIGYLSTTQRHSP